MAGEEYILRPEFDMFCRSLNGSIGRIEKTGNETREDVKALRAEVAEIRECIHTRVPWTEFNQHKENDEKEHKELRGRPSWATTIALTFLSSLSLGLLGTLVGVLVR